MNHVMRNEAIATASLEPVNHSGNHISTFLSSSHGSRQLTLPHSDRLFSPTIIYVVYVKNVHVHEGFQPEPLNCIDSSTFRSSLYLQYAGN